MYIYIYAYIDFVHKYIYIYLNIHMCTSYTNAEVNHRGLGMHKKTLAKHGQTFERLPKQNERREEEVH